MTIDLFTWVFGYQEMDCRDANVSYVALIVNDLDGIELFYSGPLDCETVGADITDFDVGTYNLVAVGLCSDYTTGYSLDVNVIVAHSGDNEFPTLVLRDGDGCP